jgi:hypothetical protein
MSGLEKALFNLKVCVSPRRERQMPIPLDDPSTNPRAPLRVTLP